MDILEVEKNKCIGCGACVSIDEEHFQFDDDGLSTVISNEHLDTEELSNAIECCPTGAILLAKGNTVVDNIKNENVINSDYATEN